MDQGPVLFAVPYGCCCGPSVHPLHTVITSRSWVGDNTYATHLIIGAGISDSRGGWSSDQGVSPVVGTGDSPVPALTCMNTETGITNAADLKNCASDLDGASRLFGHAWLR